MRVSQHDPDSQADDRGHQDEGGRSGELSVGRRHSGGEAVRSLELYRAGADEIDLVINVAEARMGISMQLLPKSGQ